ncbi:MAG: hypothetical protein IPO19_19630 [Rhodoferax sp.]|nr:hypothetical protein [Rhodoferax sp.]
MVGYLECMELSLSTLRLPFRSLRWGRAILAGHSLVWIDWDGGQTLSRVWLDGVLVDARLEGPGPQRIVAANWTLELQEHAVLRDRELGMALPDTIRRQAGALANSHEVKWLGHASLHGLAADQPTGWAILNGWSGNEEEDDAGAGLWRVVGASGAAAAVVVVPPDPYGLASLAPAAGGWLVVGGGLDHLVGRRFALTF